MAKACPAPKEGCKNIPCPLCTREGLAIMILGLILLYTGQKIMQIMGLILIALAYVVPLIKKN